jgi:CubicO group peptidase (beta-lactamase class C family)
MPVASDNVSDVSSIPQATAVASDVVEKMDTFLNGLVEHRLFSGSVLVAHDGDVLLTKGYGLADREHEVPNTPHTKFRIGSITKQFTAMAILLLQAQGKLSVEDRVCQHVEECPDAWQEMTIHQLLTHTSGIPNFTDSPDYHTTRTEYSTPAQTIARFADQPLDFPPGEEWSYSNSGYIVLGSIIQQASGDPYQTFLQKNVFEPLQLADTGYDDESVILKHRADGYKNTLSHADYIDMSIPYAAGGLYSTVEDLYR